MFSRDPHGKRMFEYIRDAQPGIIGVVFDIDGVEEAREKAAAYGIDSPFMYDFSEDHLKLLGWTQFNKYLEYFMDPEKTINAMVLLSEFGYTSESSEKKS